MLKRDPNCTDCKLHKSAQYVCLLGQGPIPCDVMVIGEAPGRREDDKGKPFVGRSGHLLDDMLEVIGLPREKVFITNAVSCRPPNNRTPRPAEIAACNRWLKYQIDKVKPKFILTLGNVPLISLIGEKGIKKLRGRAIEKDGRIILPTFHPSYALRDERVKPVIEQDLQTFKDIVDNDGIPADKTLNYTIVDTWEKVDEMIDSIVGAVSCDLETTGLYPWAEGAAIVSFGIGTALGEYIVPVTHKESPWSRADIKEILRLVKKAVDDERRVVELVFQAGKFDCLWMLVHYGIRFTNDFDTMLGHYLTNENTPHDLEFLAALYFGAKPWDIPLEEKQGKAPFKTIARYHAMDLFYTRKIYFKVLRDLKKDKDVYRVFKKIMMPCANLFVDIEHRGCYIDQTKMRSAERYLKDRIATATKSLNKWGEINWASPKQVGELLYGKLKIKCPQKTKKGANSTSESTLNQIDHPAVADLLTFRGANQQLSFFIEGWKPYIVDNRIHPSFKLHGTVTGRPSCEHPNFQQVPRDPRIRSLITAPPGYTLMEADLSQIELRIVAELSKEPSMMEAFRQGWDIHWLTALREIERGMGMKDLVIDTAQALFQKKGMRYGEAIEALKTVSPEAAVEFDDQWAELRKKAKAINFGYVFGMWWKKFKIYARDNYGIHLTDEQAQESRVNFFDMYSLEDWHSKQRRFAKINGFVQSLAGRKRRLPQARSSDDTPERAEALRQAINSPVQSFASDLNLMTLLELRKAFPGDVMYPVCTVHDAILAEVKNEWIDRVGKQFKQTMRGPQLLDVLDVNLVVPIGGDVKLGPWGSGKKFKG